MSDRPLDPSGPQAQVATEPAAEAAAEATAATAWHELTAELSRLQENQHASRPWHTFGPYLSERQWGTVREDYSAHGTAWDYFTHDMSRSRAYRWGEDGLAGWSDDNQHLCLSLALWNGKDAILKERLFGLTNSEGNHGEDCKEVYYYLDATPTHSYCKLLYKYPQAAFPYGQLIEENRRRGTGDPEFELMDTGVFAHDRYFDVFVEYAKASPEDTLMRITVYNRSHESAPLHVLPQVWFRNTWAWNGTGEDTPRPTLLLEGDGGMHAYHGSLGEFRVFFAPGELHRPCGQGDGSIEKLVPEYLFCDNDTNPRRLYGLKSASGYFKDGFHEYVIAGNRHAVKPSRMGTKAAGHYRTVVPPGGCVVLRLRKCRPAAPSASAPFADFDAVFSERLREADLFYAELQKDIDSEDARRVQRQALAGMIWSKQYYGYDVARWIDGDPGHPKPPADRRRGRNWEWRHLNNSQILSMPDKWEYPWYAAWDLAFHCVALSVIDAGFAKDQLVLLTREWYMHPNGQLPAYEWAFGDVNPPVHAWATWRVYKIDQRQRQRVGRGPDLEFLERVFHKLMLNFTWWVNRKDAQGRNIFQGGFLGLDNIGVFDRSAPLPTGGFINQSDGTSWMAMYSLNLMRIALELAVHNHVYEDVATKFFEHFLSIAEAMTNLGDEHVGLWDETDQFYYDVLCLPDGSMQPLKVRSMVGLIPLFAVEVIDPDLLDQLPEFKQRMEWYLSHRPELSNLISHWDVPGRGKRRLLSLLRGRRMKRLLKRMLDETEFLSPYGVRALSKVHEGQPYVIHVNGQPMSVSYQPAESLSGLFGGNSNWRGPIWFPVNYLIIESLQKFHHYYGDDFTVECPTGSGQMRTIAEVADELSARLGRLFLRDADGRRPVFGPDEKLQRDPHFRDYLLFYEYFHGDNGRGVGASHQTGWTGLVAKLLSPRRHRE